ncbi:ParA family protein [Neomegalonema perideroedes]|uniref:ParA family protein n=1 Tax=Neomegalonema perideroedes TaxID=217219 RepID=UPI00037F430E|nr:AAA family ATPase [Neomegalonema perideroedes]
MQIVAFFNNKGGVGKTTLLCNIAAACAQDLGKRVLIVDADPQRNASFYTLEAPAFNGVAKTGGLHRMLSNPKAPPATLLGSAHFGCHVLPGEAAMADLAPQFDVAWAAGDAPYILNLKSVLDAQRMDYDLILLDLPPTLNGLTRAGLIAADAFVAPFDMDMFSLEGLKLIKDWVRRWEPAWRAMTETPPEASVRARFIGGIANRMTKDSGESSEQYGVITKQIDSLTTAMARDLGDRVRGVDYVVAEVPNFGEEAAHANRWRRPIFDARIRPAARQVFVAAAEQMLSNLERFATLAKAA